MLEVLIGGFLGAMTAVLIFFLVSEPTHEFISKTTLLVFAAATKVALYVTKFVAYGLTGLMVDFIVCAFCRRFWVDWDTEWLLDWLDYLLDCAAEEVHLVIAELYASRTFRSMIELGSIF